MNYSFSRISRIITVTCYVWKSFISVFQEFFASINKVFILAGGMGTRLSFFGLSHFPDTS